MRPLTRKRRILKWAGLVACLLTAGAWLASNRWALIYRGEYFRARLVHGVMGVAQHTVATGWRAVDMRGQPVWAYLWAWRWPVVLVGGKWDFIVPLWIPLAAIGIPTILAWRRDRPIPPGHCRTCRYDLTGNESGVCPECGTAVGRA